MKKRMLLILTAVFVIGSAVTAFAAGRPELAGGVLTFMDDTSTEMTEVSEDTSGLFTEIGGMLADNIPAEPADTTTDTSTEPTDTTAEPAGIPYIEYYADRYGIDPADIDLSKAVILTYIISECEFAYPLQTIRDEESILAAEEFFRNVYVTGDPDGVLSTEGGEGMSLKDADGNVIISISIQAGMIDTSDGRRPATGLGGMSDIPGLMSPADWEEYFDQLADEEEAYLETHEFQYPCTLFEREGKAAFDFFENCTADDIDSIYFFHNGKNKTVTDRDAIREIYDSICQVQVTGSGDATRWDEQWSITIFYTPQDRSFSDDIHFGFRAGDLSADDEVYALEGLEGILESYDWEELGVIKDILGL